MYNYYTSLSIEDFITKIKRKWHADPSEEEHHEHKKRFQEWT